jgi:hypothetical protein
VETLIHNKLNKALIDTGSFDAERLKSAKAKPGLRRALKYVKGLEKGSDSLNHHNRPNQ